MVMNLHMIKLHGTEYTYKGMHVKLVKSEKKIRELYQCQFLVVPLHHSYVDVLGGGGGN